MTPTTFLASRAFVESYFNEIQARNTQFFAFDLSHDASGGTATARLVGLGEILIKIYMKTSVLTRQYSRNDGVNRFQLYDVTSYSEKFRNSVLAAKVLYREGLRDRNYGIRMEFTVKLSKATKLLRALEMNNFRNSWWSEAIGHYFSISNVHLSAYIKKKLNVCRRFARQIATNNELSAECKTLLAAWILCEIKGINRGPEFRQYGRVLLQYLNVIDESGNSITTGSYLYNMGASTMITIDPPGFRDHTVDSDDEEEQQLFQEIQTENSLELMGRHGISETGRGIGRRVVPETLHELKSSIEGIRIETATAEDFYCLWLTQLWLTLPERMIHIGRDRPQGPVDLSENNLRQVLHSPRFIKGRNTNQPYQHRLFLHFFPDLEQREAHMGILKGQFKKLSYYDKYFDWLRLGRREAKKHELYNNFLTCYAVPNGSVEGGTIWTTTGRGDNVTTTITIL